MCIGVLLAYVSVYQVWLVPTEAGRVHQNPENHSYRKLNIQVSTGNRIQVLEERQVF